MHFIACVLRSSCEEINLINFSKISKIWFFFLVLNCLGSLIDCEPLIPRVNFMFFLPFFFGGGWGQQKIDCFKVICFYLFEWSLIQPYTLYKYLIIHNTSSLLLINFELLKKPIKKQKITGIMDSNTNVYNFTYIYHHINW